MKKLFIAAVSFAFASAYSQVGIDTAEPKATLDVRAKPADLLQADGIIAPRLSGNELKAKDNVYGTSQNAAVVFATSAASPTTPKTAEVTRAGYYYYDASIVKWVAFHSPDAINNDATRFLGGTVYVRFGNVNSGTLDDSRVIGSAIGANYTIGGIPRISSVGGINSLKGSGYKISNSQNGVFDIEFDLPLTEIYGISINVVDSYGYNNGNQGGVSDLNPDPTQPGSRIKTNDNSQVSYISNSIIRIKTGNSDGSLSNRSFTFLVTGK